jgi:hypothetical protein
MINEPSPRTEADVMQKKPTATRSVRVRDFTADCIYAAAMQDGVRPKSVPRWLSDLLDAYLAENYPSAVESIRRRQDAGGSKHKGK